ncbi:MAG: hypothetical protein KGI54_16915, partial [Pseudomonadota bacterium]|nr:hypothetical protein [Pseudomonadota bacterium]
YRRHVMPFNGSGTYTLPAGNPVVTNTDISSTTQNNTMSDVATALTDCVTRDGQSPPSANLPLGGFKLTGLGAGSALTDSLTLGQAQNELGNYGGTAGGTANALTISTTPAITAYIAGQRFWFKASASGNSGATTLNIDGLGAIAAQFNRVACVGGEILANNFYQVFLDTATTCQISAISSLSSAGGTLTGALNNAPSVVLASATSTAIGAAASNNVTISGTTTITSFDTIAEGAIRLVTFSGAVPITYDATKMQLVGAASRTYAVGDVSLFRSLGSGNWKEEFYQPVGGYAALAGLSTQLFSVADATTAHEAVSAQQYKYRALFQESQPSGTNAGGSSSGYNVRVLNTVQSNNIPGCSLTSNHVTLAAGTYWFNASAPAYGSSSGVSTQLQLYDITSSSVILNGTSEFSVYSTAQTRSMVSGMVTFSATATVELRHYFSSAQATNGLGVSTNSGSPEIYSQLEIIQMPY